MSHTRRSAHAALAVTLAVAACTDLSTAPTAPEIAPSLSGLSQGVADARAQSAEPGRYFVVANGASLPAGFAEAAANLGVIVEAEYSELGVAVVSATDDRSANRLRRLNGVGFVEPEPMFSLEEPVGLGELEAADFGGSTESPGNPAAATFYPRQWNMRAIHADAAWAAGRLGSSNVTVAILDTGIDYLHQDLAGRVDLSRSVSLVPEDDFYVNLVFPGRHLIADIGFHGTHVASTVVSNGLGTAGVTSGVTLVGIKVCSVALGTCRGGAVFEGILRAVEIGADVANMSLGGAFSKRDFPGAVSAFQRLFNWAKQSGTTFVVSAGNSAFDLDHDGNGFKTYCSVANVICVSATAPTGVTQSGPVFTFTDPDAPASYSNYGRSAVSLAAPGGDFYDGVAFDTGVLAACSSSSLLISSCRASNRRYVFVAGTSMAAPHVSGVAALLVEELGRNPAQIRARLQQSADDLGQPGTDPFYGKGRLNAASAVGVN